MNQKNVTPADQACTPQPCPGCKQKPVIAKAGKYWIVACPTAKCKFSGSTRHPDYHQAIKDWNTEAAGYGKK